MNADVFSIKALSKRSKISFSLSELDSFTVIITFLYAQQVTKFSQISVVWPVIFVDYSDYEMLSSKWFMPSEKKTNIPFIYRMIMQVIIYINKHSIQAYEYEIARKNKHKCHLHSPLPPA